jgi:acetyltransferase-like isoleucine patch superfamily enzyme
MRTFFRPLARRVLRPILQYALDVHLVVGSRGSLIVGQRSALANTIFNVASGSITVGNRVIFSQNVMVLTGRHDFHAGKRVSLYPEWDDGSWGGNIWEVPTEGNDIAIGDGTWVGAGAIILGPVNIGRNTIVAAGSVVTHDVNDYEVVAGVPARVIGDTRDRRVPRLEG